MGSWTYTLMTSAEIGQEEFRRFLRREARKLRPEGIRWATDRVAGYERQLWKPNHSYVWIAWCPDDPMFPDVHQPLDEPELEQDRRDRLRELEEITRKLDGEPPRTFILLPTWRIHRREGPRRLLPLP